MKKPYEPIFDELIESDEYPDLSRNDIPEPNKNGTKKSTGRRRSNTAQNDVNDNKESE